MVKKLERFGRQRTAKGFYEYPADGKKKRLWPELQKYFPADPQAALRRKARTSAPKEDENQESACSTCSRSITRARCLEANVLTNPAGRRRRPRSWGLGFAPQTGGGGQALIDQVGHQEVRRRNATISPKKYGPQFEVPKLLRDMAAKGQGFYGQLPSGQGRLDLPPPSHGGGAPSLRGQRGERHPDALRKFQNLEISNNLVCCFPPSGPAGHLPPKEGEAMN